MHTNTQVILVLAGQVLNIKAVVKKDWYIEAFEQLWRDEITKAISDARRRRPRCAAEPHAEFLS